MSSAECFCGLLCLGTESQSSFIARGPRHVQFDVWGNEPCLWNCWSNHSCDTFSATRRCSPWMCESCPFPIAMHQFMSFITLCRFCIIHSGAARTAHCDLKQSWLDGKPAGRELSWNSSSRMSGGWKIRWSGRPTCSLRLCRCTRSRRGCWHAFPNLYTSRSADSAVCFRHLTVDCSEPCASGVARDITWKYFKQRRRAK